MLYKIMITGNKATCIAGYTEDIKSFLHLLSLPVTDSGLGLGLKDITAEGTDESTWKAKYKEQGVFITATPITRVQYLTTVRALLDKEITG